MDLTLEERQRAALHAIKVLNEALQAEPDIINAIFRLRFPVNEALANHPSIQVMAGSPPTLGVLGLINGLFGVDEHQWGLIASSHADEHSPITLFMPTHEATDHPSKK